MSTFFLVHNWNYIDTVISFYIMLATSSLEEKLLCITQVSSTQHLTKFIKERSWVISS